MMAVTSLSDTTSSEGSPSRKKRLPIFIGVGVAVIAIVVVSILTGGKVNDAMGRPANSSVRPSRRFHSADSRAARWKHRGRVIMPRC